MSLLPRSAITRLRLAFASIGGLTLVALGVGCVAFVYSLVSQRQLLEESTPLLITVEKLPKAVIQLAAATERLEAATSFEQLRRIVEQRTVQRVAIQELLADLGNYTVKRPALIELGEIIEEGYALNQGFADAVGEKIKASAEIADTRRAIFKKGEALLNDLRPRAFQASDQMIGLLRQPEQRRNLAAVLERWLVHSQRLATLSFGVDRLLVAAEQIARVTDSDDQSNELLTSVEELLPIANALDSDEGDHEAIVSAMEELGKIAFGPNGLLEQRQRLDAADASIQVLKARQTALFERMTAIVDLILGDARQGYVKSASTASSAAFQAVALLSLLAVMAFGSLVLIGWQLIERGIARRLALLAASTQRLSKGDLNVAIDLSGDDEIGMMSRAVEGFRQQARQRQQVNRALADANAELARSNRELDDFCYIASHDLKEPLRAIHNHASFLLTDHRGKLDEDGERRLHRLTHLSRRMEELIQDLLSYSRIKRSGQALERLQPEEIIADIESALSDFIAERNGRLQILNPLPPIEGDRGQITILFQNLVVNALKYNESREKLVEIGTVELPAAGDQPARTAFFVRDNGIGIKEEFKDEVFRIFKRLNGDKAYGGGTGAGLTFVKKIVENHGGQIWLESGHGNGTTFYFTLGRNL